MPGKKKLGRTWLNPKDSSDTGAMSYSVQTYADDNAYVHADLEITDATRAISLDFDFSDLSTYTARRKKLDLIQAELSRLGQAMDDAAASRKWWSRD